MKKIRFVCYLRQVSFSVAFCIRLHFICFIDVEYLFIFHWNCIYVVYLVYELKTLIFYVRIISPSQLHDNKYYETKKIFLDMTGQKA